jgi:hypothetical protein
MMICGDASSNHHEPSGEFGGWNRRIRAQALEIVRPQPLEYVSVTVHGGIVSAAKRTSRVHHQAAMLLDKLLPSLLARCFVRRAKQLA